MKWKTTWLLVGLAAVLFAFIWMVERHSRATSTTGEPPPRLLPISAADITSVQVRRTNQFVLRADRTNQVWTLTAPSFYPAQTLTIRRLLQTLEELAGYARIPAEDLVAKRRAAADYGLDFPRAALTLHAGEQRVELLFGAKTSVGDQVYLQLLGSPSIYLAPAEIVDRIPRAMFDWRDLALVNLDNLPLDRFEVRSAGRGFAVQVDRTNSVFYLSKPTPARADRARVEALLGKVNTARVAAFVTDDPQAELELYGLQNPEAEFAFGQGTNDVIVVQFGKSPTNDPALVYARRLAQTNIVLVPKALLEAIQAPYTELRERRLLTFNPAVVDRIEIVADEKFVVSRQTNGQWIIEPPLSQAADGDAVRECLDLLGRLEGNVEKDVVTDFASYGLAPPLRQYALSWAQTNAVGSVSNRLGAQLDLGARENERVYARGADVNSVFSISRGDYEILPSVAWQLRDRRVWSFTTNQVVRLALRQNGYTREMVRQGPGIWKLAPGSTGIINPLAIEEMIYRLGDLRADFWVDRGDRNRARYGFRDDGYQITIELQGSGTPKPIVLEFAAQTQSQLPLALASFDEQTWIFKFPPRLFFELVRDLSNPPKARPAPPEG
jgi:hypothetical protein